MRKAVTIALGLFAAIAIATVSAAGGFYFGFFRGVAVGGEGVGEGVGIIEAHRALSEVDSSLVALDKSDLSLSQRQLALHMRTSLARLGDLSKIGAYVECTDNEKRSLAAAADFMATHPDPVLFGPDPSVGKGMKFCESYRGFPGVTATYMTTGK